MGVDSVGTVLVLAGGTGGHVYPALAVAQELESRGYGIRWLGTERGLEARVVPGAGFALDFIKVRGLRGKGLLSRLGGLLALMLSAVQSFSAVLKIKPVCVLGMGGYVAGPAGLAAWILRKPLVIHEQNSVAGTTNRLLYRLATQVLAAYPSAFDKATVVGNPVRRELLEAGSAVQYEYTGQRAMRLAVIGGSLGAKAINEAMTASLAYLPQDCRLEIRHQTGVDHADSVRQAYGDVSNVEVLPYVEDMAALYNWADLVVCRAGALTVAELSIMARPAILIPLPGAIDNHQAHNADWLEQRSAAKVLLQSELDPARLARMLADFAAQPMVLKSMSQSARRAAFPQATMQVADVCAEVSCA